MRISAPTRPIRDRWQGSRAVTLAGRSELLTRAINTVRGGKAYSPVVTRVTTGRIRQHFPDEETDGAHVDGRSNTGCTDSITLPR